MSPLELVSACLTILGTNFIALLWIQWHSLIAPNTDPSHANRNTPTGMIFKMSTPSLEGSLTKLADNYYVNREPDSLLTYTDYTQELCLWLEGMYF